MEEQLWKTGQMKKVWPKYIYTYVYDVYDRLWDNAAYHGYTYYDYPVETFTNYSFAAFNWPNAKIVPKPTSCTCVECGVITNCASFRNLIPLHANNCKNARRTTKGNIEANPQEVPQS